MFECSGQVIYSVSSSLHSSWVWEWEVTLPLLFQSSGTRRDQARQLLRDLETRGSRAFPSFLECLREGGFESLAVLLQSGDPAGQPVPNPLNPVIRPLPVCKSTVLDVSITSSLFSFSLFLSHVYYLLVAQVLLMSESQTKSTVVHLKKCLYILLK